jgi:O-antigen/teichoic acid export membrane protein
MNLTRSVVKHAAIYGFATLLGRVISFLMLPIYAHIFHAEGYGVMAMIDATLGILVIMFASGLHVAIVRVYHEESAARKPFVFGTAMTLVAVGAAAVIALPIALAPQLSRLLLGSDQYSAFLVLALLGFLIDIVGQSASTSLIVKQRSALYSAVNLVRLVVALSLNIGLVVVLGFGLIGVYISALVTALIGSALFISLVIREHGIHYDRDVARKLLRFQLPMLPADVISFLSRYAEHFLIRFMIDIRAVGVLDMAYKFPPLLNLLVTLPFLAAWRTKSIEIAERDPNAPTIIGRMFTNYFFVIVFAGLVLGATVEDLLTIMTPPEFWPAARVARVDIITVVLSGVNTLLLFGLIFRKMTTTISKIRISLAVVKIPLAFVMISSFQLAGAAYSALLIEAVMTGVVLAISQRSYRVEYEYARVALIGCAGLLLGSVIVYDGLLGMFDLVAIKRVTTQLIEHFFELAPLAKQEWLTLLLSKLDVLISLGVDLLCTLGFLLVIPLLFLPRAADRPRLAV